MRKDQEETRPAQQPVSVPSWPSGLVGPVHLVTTEDEDALRTLNGLVVSVVFARGRRNPDRDGGSLLALPDGVALGPPPASGEDIAIGLAGRLGAGELGLNGVVDGEVVEVERLRDAHLLG